VDLLVAPPLAGGQLTDSDARLLRLLADGLCDGEIAERVCLSPHTVKHRLDRLRDRYGLRNRIALAAWAVRNGIA